MGKFIKAWQVPNGRTVYEDAEGNLTVREDGDANWRNNNPGNVRYNDRMVSLGAIGSMKTFVQTDFGTMAIFPDRQTGLMAQGSLLSDIYLDVPLRKAINKYSPSTENEGIPEKVKDIAARLGVSPDTRVRDLGPEGIENLKKHLIRYESPEKPGREYTFQAGTPENEKLRGEKILHYHYARRLPAEELQKEENLNALFRSSDYNTPPVHLQKEDERESWPKRRNNMHALVEKVLQETEGGDSVASDLNTKNNASESKKRPPRPLRKPGCIVDVSPYRRDAGKEYVRAHIRSCPDGNGGSP